MRSRASDFAPPASRTALPPIPNRPAVPAPPRVDTTDRHDPGRSPMLAQAIVAPNPDRRVRKTPRLHLPVPPLRPAAPEPHSQTPSPRLPTDPSDAAPPPG